MSIAGGAFPAAESHKTNTAPKRSDLLRAALEYAEAGIPVFPCKPGEKRPCYAKGALEHGHTEATTDRQRIQSWWSRWPTANIGVPTGSRSGWLVVDVDHGPALEALEAEYGELPATRTVGTGSGGMHLCLTWAGGLTNSPGELPEGIDVRGEGGYVVVPPSRTTRPYELLDDLPLAEAPAWLLQALTVPKKASTGNRQSEAPLVVLDSGPIPDGRRHTALASIAGRLHDGTRTLDELTADLEAVNMARCVPPIGEDDPKEIGDVAKTAASIHRREPCKPQGKRAPEEVQRRLLAFEARLETITWSGHASNRLSLLKTYALLARKHGMVREDGVAISVSNSQAALNNGCSDRAVRRNNAKLVKAGLIRTDNEGRLPTDAGTIVLLIPASEHVDNPTEPGSVLTHTHQGAYTGEGEDRQPEAGGGGLGQNAAPAPWEATRARHGKPLYDDGELVGFLGRMGKRAEFAVDRLGEAGGRLSEPELAEKMGIRRARNMRASAWLTRLLDAGVVERDAGGYLCLTADWLGAWERRRVEDEEEMDRERDRERYRRMSEGWAQRVAEHADNLRQGRLERVARACFAGGNPVDGLIGELEPVEEATGVVQESQDGHTPDTHPIHTERHPGEAPEPHDLPRLGHTADIPPTPRRGDLSDLATALAGWLERNPGDHPERHPPGDFAAQLSWLAGTLWAHDLVEGRPDPLAVARALGELDGAEVAA